MNKQKITRNTCINKLFEPDFVDHMYTPYEKLNNDKTPIAFYKTHEDGIVRNVLTRDQLKFSHVEDTPYPLVDPYRRRLGEGLRFRSQHEGICPLGWKIGENQYCHPIEEESEGLFYKRDIPGVNTPKGGLYYGYEQTHPYLKKDSLREYNI
jgi:hypothetical protein